eukprot:TRINITY_DN69021_c0_g1_i1.p1 TRINITY_DN69021_c0_g1~~TRINITY_DN69021_c0_g1_i1.p1  ORF type:complete len:157 (-),score=32.66 TRINITY_DN69021_c0_g1_i1:251-721(-)
MLLARRATQDLLRSVVGRNTRTVYSARVREMNKHPQHVGKLDASKPSVGHAVAGAAACGDVMEITVDIDAEGLITAAKWKTFGCGSAIASSELTCQMLIGKTIEEAKKITNKTIAAELSLPPVKLHCSLLAEEALNGAIDNWTQKQKGAYKVEVGA